ncbi:hypothetical protein D3C80_1676630 [compost metagenome]
MAVGQAVAVLLNLYLVTTLDSYIPEYLDPKDIVLFEGMTVVYRDVDLIFQGFIKLCCIKIELGVHNNSNLGKQDWPVSS